MITVIRHQPTESGFAIVVTGSDHNGKFYASFQAYQTHSPTSREFIGDTTTMLVEFAYSTEFAAIDKFNDYLASELETWQTKHGFSVPYMDQPV